MLRRTQFFAVWCAVVVLLSSGFLYDFVKRSLTEGYSSQAVLVPFISAYLIWQERKRIFLNPEQSPMAAFLLVVAGFALFFVGRSYPGPAGVFTTSAIRLVGTLLMIIGGFVGVYGVRAFRAGLFPFGLLLFMAPLPLPVANRVIEFLQVQSADLSYRLFSLVGVPVYREGVVLMLPSVSIEVAKECSGINSSLALLLTSLLVSWSTLRTASRRIILVLVIVPLSIVKNAVRIVTLTLLAVYVDPSFLTGRLHHQGGFVFFAIALAMLYPVWRLLQKSERLTPAQDPVPIQPLAHGATPK